MSILTGDTNGNGTVNASDLSQTKSRIGQQIDGTNFRSDVNAGGLYRCRGRFDREIGRRHRAAVASLGFTKEREARR